MYLFVDTSNQNSIELALFDPDGRRATQIEEGDRQLTEKLLFFITSFLSDQNVSVDTLGGIIAVSGPGSFTGLRVTAVVLNTIAKEKSIPLYVAKKESLATDEQIIQALAKVSHKTVFEPFYDREPNITVN